jgi:ankyrin repeat protein
VNIFNKIAYATFLLAFLCNISVYSMPPMDDFDRLDALDHALDQLVARLRDAPILEICNAAAGGDCSRVQYLVEHGARIHQLNFEGKTPLHLAAENGNLPVVQYLVERGADVNYKDPVYQTTPLHLAAEKGHLPVAQYLLEHGADVDSKSVSDRTPLHAAAKHNNRQIVKLLLQLNATVNQLTHQDESPLHEAVSAGATRIVRMLIEKGANVDQPDVWGYAPLHRAAMNYRHPKKITTMLIRHKATIEQKNRTGQTPLHIAAMYGNTTVAKILIEHGASGLQRDEEGKTFVQIAIERRYPYIVALWRTYVLGFAQPMASASIPRLVSDSPVGLLDQNTICAIVKLALQP